MPPLGISAAVMNLTTPGIFCYNHKVISENELAHKLLIVTYDLQAVFFTRKTNIEISLLKVTFLSIFVQIIHPVSLVHIS